MGGGAQEVALRRDYERQLGPRIRTQLRFGIFVVVALQASFPVVDYATHPERIELLVGLRGVCVLAMLGLLFVLERMEPIRAMLLGCLASGIGLVAVIVAAGGPRSGYAPGLMLQLLGMPVLLPLSAKQASWLSVVLLGTFLGAPIVTGEVGEWRDFALYACFPIAAGLECVAACQVLDQLRFTDFQRQKEIEEARDRLQDLDKAKSRFTANIHHELRTPLTLMLAPIEAMRSGDMGDVPSSLDRTLRTMQSNGLRLLKLINNLLDLAKIESEQLSVRRVPVELGRLVQDIVDGALPMAERKGLYLRAEGFGELPTTNVDPDALEKVLGPAGVGGT